MEIRVPHQIIYQTPEPVPVADAIEALLGTERVLVDIAPLLEGLFPGLEANARVYVQEIAEGASLKEVVMVAIFATFQQPLEKAMPSVLDSIFGSHPTEGYNTIISLLFLLLTFYGVDAVFQKINKAPQRSRIHAQLEGLVGEVAKDLDTTEDAIRDVLHNRYSNSTRRKLLARGAVRIFTPSKRQNNAGVVVDDRRIEPILVAEVPSDAQVLDAEEPDSSAPVENVRIELHAQDMIARGADGRASSRRSQLTG